MDGARGSLAAALLDLLSDIKEKLFIYLDTLLVKNRSIGSRAARHRPTRSALRHRRISRKGVRAPTATTFKPKGSSFTPWLI